ncbi:hypothetical protein JL720_10275 [Aureococcus anophagefferens]|nr:hypothetical protein JL720_10275 [Aureococcus anophagefferens]
MRRALLWTASATAFRTRSAPPIQTRTLRQATTIAGETAAVEYEVKKSRFVARAAPATTFEEAEAFIGRHADDKARHNCWAWFGAASARQSDDGEPTGTAAQPIRAAIEGADFVDCAVLHRGVRVAAEDFADDGAARLSLRLDDAGLRDDLSREAEAAGATVER